MGRVYATAAQYQTWAGVAGPADIDRRLARASELVEQATMRALYDVDTAGLPTKAEVVTAFQEATCAAALHLKATGDELGTAGRWQSVSIGSVAMSRGGGALSPEEAAERIGAQARTILTLAALLTGPVQDC